MKKNQTNIHKKITNKKLLHKKESKSKGILIVFTILIVFIIVNVTPLNNCSADSKEIQEGIANQIIRFHVLANSDSNEDQALKLKVKDAVVDAMRDKLGSASSKEEAREDIINNIPEIKKIALNVIKDNGYNYDVNVSLSNTYFPTKVYGDLTFPPGVYEALRIQIGGAEGKNWWCVMFPPLCFVDTTYSIVPKESKNKLKTLLTTDEYDAISGKNDIEVKVKFRFVELIKGIFS